jgi:peroxiredoxin
VTFLLVLLTLSLAANVYLAQRVFYASPEPATSAPPPQGVPQPALAAGTSLPPLEVKSLTGEEQIVDYEPPQSTVLYFFSPDCGWCGKNLANIQHLAAETAGSYRFIGVSLKSEGLEKYLEDNDLEFPVYYEPSAASRDAYRLMGVPQTLVVNGNGEVVKNWRGAFAEPLESEVEDFFEVELPGLTEETQAQMGRKVVDARGLHS